MRYQDHGASAAPPQAVPTLRTFPFQRPGNLCQIIAQSVCKVPYGIAYPLLQAGLMVSGFLGIYVFREIVERPAILVFFACAGLVLVGAVLLGLYGPS